MEINKAFILATAGSYLGLALASLIGYPTVIGAPIWIIWGWLLAALVFLGWGASIHPPSWVNRVLGIVYGVICLVTFIGLENWGSLEINLAMALWDMICALCFLLG